jgi:hypothetical protein
MYQSIQETQVSFNVSKVTINPFDANVPTGFINPWVENCIKQLSIPYNGNVSL